jgi:hypothetical protein
VVGDYPDVPKVHVPPRWMSTTTIQACTKRGWFELPNYYTALLTEVGRGIVAESTEIAVDLPSHHRLTDPP